jgi:hypothetical protein
LLLLISPWASPAPQQQNEIGEARGAFLVTRKNPAPPKKPEQSDTARRKPGATGKEKPTAPQKPGSAAQPAAAPGAGQQPAGPPQPPTPESGAIGLGITLYQLKEGKTERVSLLQPFYENDQVRFVVEPNIDGYLYIFQTENGEEPEMIFPDHRLDKGANLIEAHVPYEAPSRKAENDWFVFDNNPARLTFYFVVSRQPLPDVPIDRELVDYCREKGQECIWKPSLRQFGPVLAEAAQEKRKDKKESLKQALAPVESAAIARRIKLKPKEPEPDIVHLNISKSSDILVVATELTQLRKP